MKKINLKTAAARRNLKAYREPYWAKFPTAIISGASLGFRRSPQTGAESWHVRVFLDGKYHRSNLGTVRPEFEYKEAYRAALDWAKSIKYSGPEVKEHFTLRDIVDEYLTKLQGNSSARFLARRDQAEMRLDALLSDEIKKRRVERLTARDISGLQGCYQQRTNHGGDAISPESVNRAMTHLIAALRHGYRLGMIESDAAWKHYQRLQPEPRRRKTRGYVSKKKRRGFANACPEQLKAFVSAMDYFGARPSEICRLKVSDVDLHDNRVRLTTYKGRARTRDFPLPEEAPVRSVLEALVKDKAPTDFVFTTSTGKPWTQANLAKAHKAVREKVGLPPDFDTYSWRHCRITDLVNGGAPAPAVSELTGTSLEHIQKNYYKSDASRLAQIALL